jgi:hypothetical protein
LQQLWNIVWGWADSNDARPFMGIAKAACALVALAAVSLAGLVAAFVLIWLILR